MNQKTSTIAKVAFDLMNASSNLETTTLDIKEELKKMFPNIIWTQYEVSSAMREIFDENIIPALDYKDNGTFRTYYLDIDDNVSPVPSSMTVTNIAKSISTSSPVPVPTPAPVVEYEIPYLGGKFVTTNLDDAKTFVSKNGLDLHYSNKRKKFMQISTMDMKHVFYALRLELKNSTDENQMRLILEGPLAKKFLNK